MKILLTGRTGQVGRAILACLGPDHSVIAPDRAGLDLTDLQAIRRIVAAARPDVIVNPAAYTAVDRAESEPELAFRINAEAPAALARAAAECGAALIHFSTDYVFDGRKDGPYTEDDVANPLSVYGRSKLAGDEAVLASGTRAVILRTSWVYDAVGRNFLTTMLRLGAERETLRVVADQHGAPTSAGEIARAVLVVLERFRTEADTGPTGIFNCGCAGETTWHGFAEAIFAAARSRGRKLAVENVVAIPTTEYPTPARRPANSRLDMSRLERSFGVVPAPWAMALNAVLEEA